MIWFFIIIIFLLFMEVKFFCWGLGGWEYNGMWLLPWARGGQQMYRVWWIRWAASALLQINGVHCLQQTTMGSSGKPDVSFIESCSFNIYSICLHFLSWIENKINMKETRKGEILINKINTQVDTGFDTKLR